MLDRGPLWMRTGFCRFQAFDCSSSSAGLASLARSAGLPMAFGQLAPSPAARPMFPGTDFALVLTTVCFGSGGAGNWWTRLQVDLAMPLNRRQGELSAQDVINHTIAGSLVNGSQELGTELGQELSFDCFNFDAVVPRDLSDQESN